MFSKKRFGFALILGCAMLLTQVAAQESAGAVKTATSGDKASADKGKSQASDAAPMEQYRLEFSINELEDGKKINSRQYSVNLNTGESNEIKIGTRVPVQGKEGEFQYLDVGTNIFARIGENRGQEQLVVRADLSNFAMADRDPERHDLHPIVRQIKLGGSTLLPLTKPIVLGSADDPNSKREFQLEVTATKIR